MCMLSSVREDSESGVEPPTAVDNSPCLCNFLARHGGWHNLFAVRLSDFYSCLTLIMWHNKLPGNIKLEENRSTATAPDRAGEARSAVLDPDAGGVRAGCRRTQTSLRTQVLLSDLRASDVKTPLASCCFSTPRMLMPRLAHSRYSQPYLHMAAAVWPVTTSTVAVAV